MYSLQNVHYKEKDKNPYLFHYPICKISNLFFIKENKLNVMNDTFFNWSHLTA